MYYKKKNVLEQFVWTVKGQNSIWTKGQTKKWFFQADDSSKKRTNEFVLFA